MSSPVQDRFGESVTGHGLPERDRRREFRAGQTPWLAGALTQMN